MKTMEQILESATETQSGAHVVSVDEMSAESLATLHSLNSREPGGWRENIKKLFDKLTGKLIKRILKHFYVGYGHKSIGDCGSGDVLVDGCSLLAANHFEHWRLFNGQETSTRYVDVTSTSTGYVPTGISEIDAWTLRWLEFYQKALPIVIADISAQNPYTGRDDDGEAISEAEWVKAVRARACDICGAFLPCGTRTNFSMHMTLRQFADQLLVVGEHPLEEVRQIAAEMMFQLKRDHPNSFKPREKRSTFVEERARWTYGRQDDFGDTIIDEWSADVKIDDRYFKHWFAPLCSRAPKDELPPEVAWLGQIEVESLIDWRSFRDIHRQRSATFWLPVVTPDHGFEDWYLSQLPSELCKDAVALIEEFVIAHSESSEDALFWQYAVPMGFRVPCRVSMPLDSAVYITELRSGTSVHPTARTWAINLGEELELNLPSLQVYVCREPDKFRLARGKQDIVEKEPATEA